MRYRCIHRRRNLYPIRMMCEAMHVSPSGYYAWRTRPMSRRRRYDRELMQAIRLLHAESDGTYGSPRLHADLNDSGFACGRAKVARLMASAGSRDVRSGASESPPSEGWPRRATYWIRTSRRTR